MLEIPSIPVNFRLKTREHAAEDRDFLPLDGRTTKEPTKTGNQTARLFGVQKAGRNHCTFKMCDQSLNVLMRRHLTQGLRQRRQPPFKRSSP